jgi:hypothetical protein
MCCTKGYRAVVRTCVLWGPGFKSQPEDHPLWSMWCINVHLFAYSQLCEVQHIRILLISVPQHSYGTLDDYTLTPNRSYQVSLSLFPPPSIEETPQQMLRTHCSLEGELCNPMRKTMTFFCFSTLMEHRWNEIDGKNRSTRGGGP